MRKVSCLNFVLKGEMTKEEIKNKCREFAMKKMHLKAGDIMSIYIDGFYGEKDVTKVTFYVRLSEADIDNIYNGNTLFPFGMWEVFKCPYTFIAPLANFYSLSEEEKDEYEKLSPSKDEIISQLNKNEVDFKQSHKLA